ncbi:MAG: hypothetical protein KDB18_14310, partial [Salinibacterium sp.]|nr:hypothetical protein [Salinibacterium sp.]
MDCASETTTDSDSDLEAGLWRPVRVLYVLDDSDRGRGTAALVRLLKRIKRHQFQAAVVSIAPHGDGTEKIQGQDFRVVSLDAPDRPGLSGLKSGLRALGGLRTLIQRYQPDVLHLM